MRRLSSSWLAETGGLWDGAGMSTVQVLEEFRALPGEERKQVAEAILMEEDSWIPESFRAGMADIAAGSGGMAGLPPVSADEVIEKVASMRSEDWLKIQSGIAEMLAVRFAGSEASEIREALAEAEAEFSRGEGLSGDEMRRHFGLQ
jgi:hypothetical protein